MTVPLEDIFFTRTRGPNPVGFGRFNRAGVCGDKDNDFACRIVVKINCLACASNGNYFTVWGCYCVLLYILESNPGLRVQALYLLWSTGFLRRSPLDRALRSSRRQSCALAPRNASWLLVTPWIPRGYTFVWRMKHGRGHARTGHVENWRRSSRRPCHSSMSLEARAQTPRFNIRAEAQSTVLVARR